jgi:hypothetical protein
MRRRFVVTDFEERRRTRSRRFYLILLVVIVLVAAMTAVFMLSQPKYGPGPVRIEVISDKPYYLLGENITFSIYVNNDKDWSIPYPSEVTYKISHDNQFISGFSLNIDPPAGSITPFPPNSRIHYDNYVWNQKAGAGNNQTLVGAGIYTFTVSFSGSTNYGSGISYDIKIRSNE